MRVYAQPDAPTQKLFLTPEEYRKSLLSLVKYCHDIIPVGPDGKFYLPCRRKDKNRPGPWFVGGAVKPFVGFDASLLQMVKREMGMELQRDRFVSVAQHQYLFGEGDGLAHDAMCEVLIIRLSEEEIASVHLDPDEYETGALLAYGEEELSELTDSLTRSALLDVWKEKDSWPA
ncbi:MAG: hypothetical protein WAV50_00725 [Minisyncoccia bacterium]